MWSPLVLQLLSLWARSSIAQTITTGQSIFVSQSNSLAFGISIPSSENPTDLYFALRGRLPNTWTAIGLGQTTMKNALVFLIYQNAGGTNVTLSTRLSTSTVEPGFTPDFHVQALPGTGIDPASGTILFNGKCSGCWRWPGGSLDVHDAHAPFIYAVGPKGDLRSDDPTKSVGYHEEYGWFRMNLSNALGGAGHIPMLNLQQQSSASEVGKEYTGQRDLVATIHGIVLLVCFLGLFPACVVVLHLFQMPRVSMVGHIISGIVALAGIGIGIYGGTYYNKTENMATAHQVVGFIVLAFILIDAVLGCAYYPRYRRNKSSGKKTSRPLHVLVTSLGSLTLLLGCINGFLGYALAGHDEKNKIVGGVFAAVLVILFFTLVFARRRDSRRKMEQETHK